MLELISVHGRIPVKEVRLSGVNGRPDEDLVEFATKAARETPDSLFGHSVIRYETEDTAVVRLHTD